MKAYAAVTVFVELPAKFLRGKGPNACQLFLENNQPTARSAHNYASAGAGRLLLSRCAELPWTDLML